MLLVLKYNNKSGLEPEIFSYEENEVDPIQKFTNRKYNENFYSIVHFVGLIWIPSHLHVEQWKLLCAYHKLCSRMLVGYQGGKLDIVCSSCLGSFIASFERLALK